MMLRASVDPPAHLCGADDFQAHALLLFRGPRVTPPGSAHARSKTTCDAPRAPARSYHKQAKFFRPFCSCSRTHGDDGSIAQRARPDLEPGKPRASFVSLSYPPRRPLIFSWPAGASQLSPALPLAPVRASLELHPKLGSPVANPKPAKTPSSTRARRFPVPGPGTLPSKRKWVENSTQGFSGTASP